MLPVASSAVFDPYLAWQQMDNFITHFLFEQSNIDPKVRSRIKHFQYQYLTKVSNIYPRDAVFFEQNISSWSSSCIGDYHRFYHLNPLLNEIEAALVPLTDTEGVDVFLLSDRRSFESYLAFASSHNPIVGELFSECRLASVKGEEILLVPKSKKMTDLIHEFIVKKGFTPTLQQASAAANRLSLYQPNLTYEFPKQNSPESSFFSFTKNPIFLKFKKLGETSFSASVLIALLEGFAQINIDESFKEKGIHTLLSNSYGRVLRFLEESLLLDLSKYANWPKFESFLDLAHEEILLWLMIAEPYSDKDLETSIKKTVAPPSFLKMVSTGMAAFSEILKVVLKPEQTILLFDGLYFENRASLLTSYPSNRFYLVRFPDYRASLQENLNQLNEQNKTIDLLFIDFHENILKGRYTSHENNVADVIAQILQSGCASSSLTVVIDYTIGFLDSTEIRDLLERFKREIRSRILHIIILRSHQKFDLFGFDKISAASYCVYSRDNTLLNRFKSSNCQQIDFVSRQGLAHYFASASNKLDERRERIFSNALYVNRKIANDLKFNGKNSDQPILVVVKEDAQNFSIDVQCASNLDLPICEAFVKRGIPLMIRSSFGFNLTTVAFTSFHMLRFSIGIEDRNFLDEFIDAFNDIFLVLCQQ